MPIFPFQQVDVFCDRPMQGNPLAVVAEADGLSDSQMQAFANWTNLSETTFLLKPRDAKAHYRVRIFTPQQELPFAGHPTLGSCHVWLSQSGAISTDEILQECEAGLIRIRRDGKRLSFAAPPLKRVGPVETVILERVARGLAIPTSSIRASNWVDNGPGWMGVLLASRRDVLAVKPNFAVLTGLRVGIVGALDPATDGTQAQYEVRAFTAAGFEDPVTGSLNAGLAQWLIASGIAPSTYVAAQGTALGRAGRVHVHQQGPEIWIGGEVADCIQGTVAL
jgi:PhzF family phenazine biosynthesis protein